MSPWVVVGVAYGGDESSAPDAFRDDPTAVVRWAQAQYANGNVDAATRALEIVKGRVEAGEALPVEVLDDALIQLGEIQYNSGDVDGATKTFEWLLQRHPDAAVNPYHHDGKLVLLFEAAREALKSREKPAPKRQRYPWWGYAPFGVPQIAQGRVGPGVGFAVGQGLLLTASIGMFYDIQRFQGPWWNVRPRSKNADLAESLRYDRLLYGIQIPSTLLFYGLWAWSAVAGHSAWVDDHPVMVTVKLSRDEIGFGIHTTLP